MPPLPWAEAGRIGPDLDGLNARLAALHDKLSRLLDGAAEAAWLDGCRTGAAAAALVLIVLYLFSTRTVERKKESP